MHKSAADAEKGMLWTFRWALDGRASSYEIVGINLCIFDQIAKVVLHNVTFITLKFEDLATAITIHNDTEISSHSLNYTCNKLDIN